MNLNEINMNKIPILLVSVEMTVDITLEKTQLSCLQAATTIQPRNQNEFERFWFVLVLV